MLQKIGKGILVGVAALLCLGLLFFFVAMFFGQGGQGERKHIKDGMIKGESVIPPEQSMEQSLGRPSGSTGGVGREMFDRSPKVLTAPAPDMLDQMGSVASDSVMAEAGDRKVMKQGFLDIRVESADWTLEQIQTIAKEKGGSVFNSSFSQDTSGVKTGSVTVKVPVDRFDEAVAALKKTAAVVMSENVSGSDVTEQYIDVTARIKNKKVAEESLQALLSRAEKISDVIEITNTLASIRGEIESLEGQLRYLESQTDMASITLSITEDTKVVTDPNFRPGQTFKESIAALLQTLGQFVKGIIMLLIVGLPMLLIYGLLLWGVYLGVRKMMRKMWP